MDIEIISSQPKGVMAPDEKFRFGSRRVVWLVVACWERRRNWQFTVVDSPIFPFFKPAYAPFVSLYNVIFPSPVICPLFIFCGAWVPHSAPKRWGSCLFPMACWDGKLFGILSWIWLCFHGVVILYLVMWLHTNIYCSGYSIRQIDFYVLTCIFDLCFSLFQWKIHDFEVFLDNWPCVRHCVQYFKECGCWDSLPAFQDFIVHWFNVYVWCLTSEKKSKY